MSIECRSRLAACLLSASLVTGCSLERADNVHSISRSPQQSSASDLFAKAAVPIPYADNFGSLSGLAYDPRDDAYWTHDDNRTGTVNYPQLFQIKLSTEGFEILRRMPLSNEDGTVVRGSTSSTVQNGNLIPGGLDPEGIAVAPDGTLWMCEEESNTIFQIDRQGRILRRLYAPGLSEQTRVRGAGLEGVAVSDDGATVYAGNQTPLLGALAGDVNTFIVAHDLAIGRWRFYKYPLDAVSSYSYPEGTTGVRMGLHDMTFFGLDESGNEQLLIVERDNQRDARARDKRLYRVTLPKLGGADVVTAVQLTKTLEIDLVGQGYVLEKPEGVAVRGSTYIVVNDNVQNASDQAEFAFFKRLIPPDVACVGSPAAPIVVLAEGESCSATVSSADGRAGTCSGGGDGLGSCTLDGADPLTLGIGSHAVGVVGTARDGSTASCTSFVQVVDAAPPSVSVSISPRTLWPPNAKLRRVQVTTRASDACGPVSVSCSATSNEDDDGDIVIHPDGAFSLRAQRNEHGGCRIYTITCTATDGAGNRSVASATVVVPHDRGR